MIDLVTTENQHLFAGNVLADQHKLRYRTLITRQQWNVPHYQQMEFDQYDTPATHYFVYREKGEVLGVARLYPTHLPYMIQEQFPHLAQFEALPCSERVMEGSRFCVEKQLPVIKRRQICNQLVLAYIEFCVQFNKSDIIGVMLPMHWKTLFIKNGCQLMWLGKPSLADDGKRIVAARMPMNKSILHEARRLTGITEDVLMLRS